MRVTLAADDDDLVIEVFGREQTIDDFWDGNWLRCRVGVRAGGFRGTVEPALRSEEFERMRDGVRVCMDDLSGTFVFETMEEQVRIIANGDGIGHFAAKCEVRDAAGFGNLLTFDLRFDQTRLAPLAAELDALLAAYPVLGQRR